MRIFFLSKISALSYIKDNGQVGRNLSGETQKFDIANENSKFISIDKQRDLHILTAPIQLLKPMKIGLGVMNINTTTY